MLGWCSEGGSSKFMCRWWYRFYSAGEGVKSGVVVCLV